MTAAFLPRVVLATTAFTVLAACGAGDPVVTGGRSSGPAGLVAPGHPPPPPGTMMPGDGTGSVTFAVTRLRLGDTDPNGRSDPDAWRHFGYDLDDKVSTATSTGLCKPADGASRKNVYPDGDNGIDNNFGKAILPVIVGFTDDAPQNVNDHLAAGDLTLLIDIAHLGSRSSYDPLLARIYDGGDLGHPPKLDGSDVWPVAADALSNPADVSSATAQFPLSYLADDTWVGEAQGELRLRLRISGAAPTLDIALPILNPTVSMVLDPTHTKATGGVIAGVVLPERLQAAFRTAGGNLDPSLCSGPTIDALLSMVAQAPDILADATQDPTKTCDAISIGIGFEAVAVQLGPVQPMSPPLPACCDASVSCAAAVGPAVQTIPCTGPAEAAYEALFHCACDLACATACADTLCLGFAPSVGCSACLPGACGAELASCMAH